jgi:hypothetical protein
MGYSDEIPFLGIERPKSFSGCRTFAIVGFFLFLFGSYIASADSPYRHSLVDMSLKTALINDCLIVFPALYFVGFILWKTMGWFDKIWNKISHSKFLKALFLIIGVIVYLIIAPSVFAGAYFFMRDMWYVDFTSYIF